MHPNLELYLLTHQEKIWETRNHRRLLELPRRPWKLPKLRHLLFFW